MTTTSRAPVTTAAATNVVDLAAWRARRDQEREHLPLFAEPLGRTDPARRVLSDHDVRHRQRMLCHLVAARAAPGQARG